MSRDGYAIPAEGEPHMVPGSAPGKGRFRQKRPVRPAMPAISRPVTALLSSFFRSHRGCDNM